MGRTYVSGVVVFVLAVAVSLDGASAAVPARGRISQDTGPSSASHGGQPGYGDPVPGLTPEQLALFEEGRDLFNVLETVQSGLGPIFNKEGCGACHNAGPDPLDPAIGGAGAETVTRFGRFTGKGEFDPMVEFGGPLRQHSAISDECVEVVPFEAVIEILRVTTPMFGAGLIEAIPDATILSRHDPEDSDGDGISGKARMVFDPWLQEEHVGRFGWKAGVVTLDTFSADASLNEMGITNMLFPDENDPNGVFPPELADCDTVDELEDAPDVDGVSRFNRMATFQRLLAPPPRRPTLNGRGLALFRQIGCADCHTPVMFTGDSDFEVLANRPAFLFSDLLLHDMGALGDEIVDGPAEGTEMRTAPLWGVRVRPKLLHDGRADNKDAQTRIRHAIEGSDGPPAFIGHAGEAAASRDAWLALPAADQADILDFLESV